MTRVSSRSDSLQPYTITKSNDSDEQSIDEESLNEPLENTASSDQLSWVSKIAYASVGLPYSMQLSIIAFYINEFLLDVAKVSPGYNAVILFTSRLIDALTDPIGGYLFSRCSFRWGKMRPWILFSAPCVALSYFGVWCLPNISDGGKLAYYLVVHSLLWTFMT
ncbi:unnamed protein product, partial [Rotaria magnacalcarata]